MKPFEIKHDPLKEKTLSLAIRIFKLNRFLIEQKKEFVISKQILKSGTNPGAMVREADNAESGADFIHKLSIAQKEVCETQYWLELLWRTSLINETEYSFLTNDLKEVIKLLVSSIRTCRKNLHQKSNSDFVSNKQSRQN